MKEMMKQTDIAISGSRGLADVLWGANEAAIEQWCRLAIHSGEISQLDPGSVAAILAEPPKGTRNTISRLRQLALALREHNEYRLQALVWKACAAQGMEALNAHQRILDAQVAGGDWSGAVISGGFLLAQPEPRPYWTNATKDAVLALLYGTQSPSREDLVHVMRHTGMRFIGDILEQFGDQELLQVLLECDLNEEQLLHLSMTFAFRNQNELALRVAELLAERARSGTFAALARAAHSYVTGSLGEVHSALTQALVPPADLSATSMWNWGMLAAVCSHPSLELVAHRIADDALVLATLSTVLTNMGSRADEFAALMAALIQAGADPLVLLDLRLSSGEKLNESYANEAIKLVKADQSERQPLRIIALTRELLVHSSKTIHALAGLCRPHSARLCAIPSGAALLARVLTLSQDWAAALSAWDEVLHQSPKQTWALAQAYFVAAKLRRADLAVGYISQIDLAANSSDPSMLTLVHGACILGDIALGLSVLDKIPADTLAADSNNKVGRLRAVVTGDVNSLAHIAPNTIRAPNVVSSPRVLVIDPGLGAITGHHFGYALFSINFWSQELAIDQSQVWLCARRSGGNESIDLDPRLSASLHRCFDFDPLAFTEFSKTPDVLRNLSAVWQADLLRGLQNADLTQVQLVYCHSMKAHMVVGFAQWIARTFAGRPVCVVIGVIEVDYFSESQDVIDACNASYAQAVEILSNVKGAILTVYAETAFACQSLSLALDFKIPVHNFPYLAASLAGPAAAAHIPFTKPTVTIGLVGRSRFNRGLDIFPELMLSLSNRNDLRWILQMSRSFAEQVDPISLKYIEWAVECGLCTWHDASLDSDQYYNALREMDIVLMPYRDRYAVSGSGVFYEAIQLERYLIVPDSTFMRDVLLDWDYPSTFIATPSVSDAKRAITKILKNKENIVGQMRKLRSKKGEILPIGRFRELMSLNLKKAAGQM